MQIGSARECEWEARSEADWARLGTTSGQGPGAITVTLAANPRPTPRTAAIVVNGQRVSIAQEARPCEYTLSSTAASVGSGEERVTVSVDAVDGCTWSASSEVEWLRVPADARNGSGSIVISVSDNEEIRDRSGTVRIAGQTFTVTQRRAAAPVACIAAVDPSSLDVPAAASSHAVEFELRPTCPWNATSNDGWITITSGTSGTGDGRITFSVGANTATTSRSGSLTIAGQRVSVRQLGAQAPQPCTFTVTPANRSIAAAGGEGTVDVATRADCPWTVSENAAWLAATPMSGEGNRTVRYTVEPNTGTSSRSATLTIGGRAHRVTQAGAAPVCSYSIEPAAQTVGASGGEARFRVATQNGCAWTTGGATAWASVSPASGSGSGDVVVTVQPNTATQSRVATITAGGQSHTLTQSAAAPACTYSLDPAAQNVGAAGGEARFRVVTQSGCTWTTGGGAAWMTVGTASGTGPGEVVLTVQTNAAQQTRSATVSAGGQTHTLTQAAAAAPACTYSLDPAAQNVGAAGGEARFRVVTQSGCAWTTGGGTGWMTVGTASGSGPGEVALTVQANTAQQTRSATVTAGGQTHTLTQAAAAPACTYSLDPAGQNVGAAGGEARFRVVTQNGCTWTTGGGAAWMTIGTASGSGPGEVVLTVQANTAQQTRSATVTAGGQTHTLTQAAAAPACTYSLDPAAQAVAASAGTARFRVVTQEGCAWTTSGGAGWMTVTTASGAGPGEVVINVQENTATQTRSATVGAGGQTHTLTQAAATAAPPPPPPPPGPSPSPAPGPAPPPAP